MAKDGIRVLEGKGSQPTAQFLSRKNEDAQSIYIPLPNDYHHHQGPLSLHQRHSKSETAVRLFFQKPKNSLKLDMVAYACNLSLETEGCGRNISLNQHGHRRRP